MPRKFTFQKEEIINAALELTRERGISAVTARALGAKLGTSSQPIFGHFDSMDEVKASVTAAASELYRFYLKSDIESGKYPPYKASGMAYIRFAREQKELFKLLFMCDRSPEDMTKESPEFEEVVGILVKQTNMSRDSAILFHLEMWAFVHGVAVMIATGYYDWNEELCGRTLTDVYEGLRHTFADCDK